MSLFGARKTSTFQRAKERLDKKMAEESTRESNASSSHIGAQLEKMGTGNLDPDGTATTSEIAQEGMEDALGGPVVLPREVFNEAA